MGDAAADVSVCLVVPCFDEAQRLNQAEFARLANHVGVSLVFVDDGSTDGTAAVLAGLAAAAPGSSVLTLDRNCGKAEAVRCGLIEASTQDANWVGYVDADLATPVDEIIRLIAVAGSRADIDVLLGVRVALLGRRIVRSQFRHYAGRVFATFASSVLATPVYDTQNGAKLFRRCDALSSAIDAPFHSRWSFDVELLGRLQPAGVPLTAFWEEPLLEWKDTPGSKRSAWASVRATSELIAIWRALRRRRRCGPALDP